MVAAHFLHSGVFRAGAGWLARLMPALLLAIWLPFIAFTACAQDVQPVPVLSARIMDQTATLTLAQKEALEAKLAAFEQSRGAQVVFLIVPTTQPEDIAAYAQRIGDSWKIGRQGIGDGLLLVVAKNDRKVRIETTKALEGAIPDLAASQIIGTAITPRFKQGDFAGGLDAAADQIMARITGENLPAPEQADHGKGFDWSDLAVFLFLIVPIGAQVLLGMLGRKMGSMVIGSMVGVLAGFLTSSVLVGVLAAVAGMVFTLIYSLGSSSRGSHSSSWGGGFGGGSSFGGSSGGGFSSGGGGDFGGGGASGDW